MDAALGPPAKMTEREGELTPMMAQYFELCRAYDDSLVLFQVGDFYEAFCEAAERVARLCEVTLTKREDNTGAYPMAGVPMDSAESYIDQLLDAGYRVAVADQVEDPDQTTGVVERRVTRVVTPGTLTEDELLGSPDNNFVACLTAESETAVPGSDDEDASADGGIADRERYGLALLDVSTGDFYVTSTGRLETVRDELGRFGPAEAIVGPDAPVEVFADDCMVSPYERRAFDADLARERVGAYFGDPDRVLADATQARACGALLAYAEYTRGGLAPEDARSGLVDPEEVDGGASANQGEDDGIDGSQSGEARLDYINHLTRYDPREYMLLDRVALESLEVFDARAVHGHQSATLVEVLDETSCALGRRKLDDWLRRPLLDEDRIAARHDAVEGLVESPRVRERLVGFLSSVYDLERLVSRVSRGRATARDLRSLHDTLAVVPDVVAALDDADGELGALRERLDPLADVRELVDDAVREEPAAELTEGGILKPEWDEELAALRETERDGKSWIDDLEARERERTGIDSLKVGHNSVHGYYIEVTDPNLDSVPGDYQRRQTLKNAERFVTPELKEREDEIISAERRADDLEYELFCEVRRSVADESERVQALADRLARLDAFVSFASVAAKFDYARPEVGADAFDIVDGRHPVVERTEERFVPNDAHFDEESFLAVITGPNMSGKSTYMRQVALISVLAQAGSFVPVSEARLPVVDRVFTRVGASDDIAGGRSTFMVEMTELATILRHATEDSLVLLDEVGRGTSTADGFAIARAVTEHLHDEVSATTLFATHHHDLTALADEFPGVFNLHFETDPSGEGVEFDHSVAPGAASASYGVEVANMAGVPEAVVERSRAVLETEGERGTDEVGEGDSRGRSETDPRTNGHDTNDSQDEVGPRGSGDEHDARVATELAELDVATMTPLEALNALAELKGELEE